MNRLNLILKRNFIIIMTFVMVAALPAPAIADSTADTASDASASVTGTTRPTGASATTYHFNETSGLWENDHYTWNPVTKETLPKVALEYTYNVSTGMWDTAVWEYVPATSAYVLVPVSVLTPPAGAIQHGGPVTVPATSAATPELSGTATANGDNPLAAQSANSGTSSGGGGFAASDQLATPSAETGSNAALALNAATGITLQTGVNSAAASGNVQISRNMSAGDGASGAATASATVLNLLQSSASLAGTGLATFTADIQGNVNGDLLIDPAAFMQPATINQTDLHNLKITTGFNGAIQNDIVLGAVSGNTTATDNTTVGNISTGGADAIANVLNMINSVVAANQSFLGVINIYGNYTGDILVPSGTLNALLAGNSTSAVANQSADDTSLQLNSSSDQNIDNNIDLAAVSGNANSSDNTNAGNVASGDALTRLTILNLTGREVNAANSLLVFVNVLGTWIGLIMDAPAGTTAAALGGGVTPGSDAAQQLASQLSDDTEINISDTSSITNNISARARSGDADATGNFRVGDITTGRATASANVANIMNSQFSLSNWFGVLFINVFGSWIGSFGAADPDEPETVASSGGRGAAAGPVAAGSVRLFSFAPPSQSSHGLSPVSRASFSSEEQYEDFIETVNEVVTENKIVESIVSGAPAQPQIRDQGGFSLSALPIILGLAGLSVVGTERIREIRRRIHYHLR